MSGKLDRRWEKKAARLVRARLAAAGMNYIELAGRLSSDGRTISVQSVRSKLSRGTFSAAFLLEVLTALECRSVEIPD